MLALPSPSNLHVLCSSNLVVRPRYAGFLESPHDHAPYPKPLCPQGPPEIQTVPCPMPPNMVKRPAMAQPQPVGRVQGPKTPEEWLAAGAASAAKKKSRRRNPGSGAWLKNIRRVKLHHHKLKLENETRIGECPEDFGGMYWGPEDSPTAGGSPEWLTPLFRHVQRNSHFPRNILFTHVLLLKSTYLFVGP